MPLKICSNAICDTILLDTWSLIQKGQSTKKLSALDSTGKRVFPFTSMVVNYIAD